MRHIKELFNKGVLFQGFVSLSNIEDAGQGSELSNLFSAQSGDLSDFINKLFIFMISIGAMLAVLRLMWAGYLYMGKGFDNWGTKSSAKVVFQDTIIGLLLLLAIATILFQINPKILNLETFRAVKPLGNLQAPPPTGSGTCDESVCVCRKGICATAR